MIWEKDVKVPLRDGVQLLADIFRPMNSDTTPVPAIMPWSPYGKTGSGRTTISPTDGYITAEPSRKVYKASI